MTTPPLLSSNEKDNALAELSLQDKVVLVTGSARRVGKAILTEFARHGSRVVVHYNSSENEAQLTATEISSIYGVETLICQANHSHPAEVDRMFEKVTERFGHIDVLVNSAANFTRTPLLDVSYEEWQHVIGVNLTGPWLCLQAAGRLMRERGGGAIINIGDNSGLHPWSTRPTHSISKAGVIALTKTAAAALARYNIRVNCVVPGPIMKPPEDSEEAWQRAVSAVPMGDEGSGADVGRACVFLAKNDFINGAVLTVDGGESVGSRK
ncbi:MAG: SDR family oxidoreductase [Chloroflexi bacterium]|nr:SDR family oxidoreductase [Chloroflexota bacterium]